MFFKVYYEAKQYIEDWVEDWFNCAYNKKAVTTVFYPTCNRHCHYISKTNI